MELLAPPHPATLEIRQLISEELARRCRKNPRYSLRAFARSVGVSHALLSLVLSGKRPLTHKTALRVADALSLDPSKREKFMGAVLKVQTRAATPVIPPFQLEMQQMSLDTFALISEWQHYAILSLLELPNATRDPKWISRKLNISFIQAKVAVERLERLGLIAQDAQGRWKQTGKAIKIENTVSTPATRRFHRQLLKKAVESLENDPPEKRDFASMTFAMDPKLLPLARSRLKEFRRALVAELEAKGNPGAVFNFTTQFCPVTVSDAEDDYE